MAFHSNVSKQTNRRSMKHICSFASDLGRVFQVLLHNMPIHLILHNLVSYKNKSSIGIFVQLIFFSHLQAQFILCIIHSIRALWTGCDFPPFMTALLLLNSLIFFVLFMNFYIQNYKKARSLQKKVD